MPKCLHETLIKKSPFCLYQTLRECVRVSSEQVAEGTSEEEEIDGDRAGSSDKARREAQLAKIQAVLDTTKVRVKPQSICCVMNC